MSNCNDVTLNINRDVSITTCDSKKPIQRHFSFDQNRCDSSESDTQQFPVITDNTTKYFQQNPIQRHQLFDHQRQLSGDINNHKSLGRKTYESISKSTYPNRNSLTDRLTQIHKRCSTSKRPWGHQKREIPTCSITRPTQEPVYFDLEAERLFNTEEVNFLTQESLRLINNSNTSDSSNCSSSRFNISSDLYFHSDNSSISSGDTLRDTANICLQNQGCQTSLMDLSRIQHDTRQSKYTTFLR